MELPELLGRIEYFLVHQDGLSAEQITTMSERPDFGSVLLPHIEDVWKKIKSGSQQVDALDQNKNLLMGVQ